MPNHDVLRATYLRAKIVEYLYHWIGTPYTWGGDDYSSFDCSGLMMEVLQGVGLIRHGLDYGANALYTLYRDYQVTSGYGGCLVFWFNDAGRATHVEMMIDDKFVVGASGGGSKTLTLADAIKQNAFCKMRPVWYRGDNFKIIDPFKSLKSKEDTQ